MTAEDRRAIESIARRYRSGAMSMGWALHLVQARLNLPDAWSPIKILSEEVLRQIGS